MAYLTRRCGGARAAAILIELLALEANELIDVLDAVRRRCHPSLFVALSLSLSLSLVSYLLFVLCTCSSSFGFF